MEDLARQISKQEHEADIIKNEIRNHLPKSIFLPVSRSDTLSFLKEQDAIAFRDGFEVAQVAHEDTVHSCNDIAGAQVSLRRRATFLDSCHLDAALARRAGRRKAGPGQSGVNICA